MGTQAHVGPRTFTEFTGIAEADSLLNDLETCPHAFVMACVVDRQIKAERAWAIPYALATKLHEQGRDFSMDTLQSLDVDAFVALMTSPVPLHRFPNNMARYLHAAVQRIADEYAGDASLIWSGSPPSAVVVNRFLQFKGVGQKIATMATNILVRHFRIPLSDYYSVDVSLDVHVRRVFMRLGLVGPSASAEELIYRARAMSPDYPGLVDLPAWEIGRTWCHPTDPECHACSMSDLCPQIGTGRSRV